MANYRKKLIEVAMPLEDINREAAREKSIRHDHTATLHLWWARRALAACRAVLFASLVDDPSESVADWMDAAKRKTPGAVHQTQRKATFVNATSEDRVANSHNPEFSVTSVKCSLAELPGQSRKSE